MLERPQSNGGTRWSDRPPSAITYQDLLSLPESPTHRHEILDGKLYVTAAPRVNHQRVVLDLGAMMRTLAR